MNPEAGGAWFMGTIAIVGGSVTVAAALAGGALTVGAGLVVLGMCMYVLATLTNKEG